jgi:hypothetical protein
MAVMVIESPEIEKYYYLLFGLFGRDRGKEK